MAVVDSRGGTQTRVLEIVGLALVAVGAVVWVAVTANGIGAGLVASDVAAGPLFGLLVGLVVSEVVLLMFIPASVSVARTSSRRRLVTIGVLAPVGVSAPIVTVALWNFHVHRLEAQPIEQFAEASLLLIGAAVVTWLATVVLAALPQRRWARR